MLLLVLQYNDRAEKLTHIPEESPRGIGMQNPPLKQGSGMQG